MPFTTDPNHPDLKHGPDKSPVPQQETYLVLSEEERAKGFLKPLRQSYRHKTCDGVTTMGTALAATYARDPWFYGGTYCTGCAMHRPLTEFIWLPDGESMDPQHWTEAEIARVQALRAQDSSD